MHEVKQLTLNACHGRQIELSSPSKEYWMLKYVELLEKYNEELMIISDPPLIIKSA